jgi:hypothetical protein
MILLHVSAKEALPLQRISKHWQTTIQTSPPLQQALFRRPISQPLPPPPGHLEITKRTWNGQEWTTLSLVRKAHVLEPDTDTDPATLSCEQTLHLLRQQSKPTSPPTTNPLIPIALNSLGIPSRPHKTRPKRRQYAGFHLNQMAAIEELNATSPEASSSFKEMYITQPPVERVLMICICDVCAKCERGLDRCGIGSKAHAEAFYLKYEPSRVVEVEGGVRIKDLLDAFEKASGEKGLGACCLIV